MSAGAARMSPCHKQPTSHFFIRDAAKLHFPTQSPDIHSGECSGNPEFQGSDAKHDYSRGETVEGISVSWTLLTFVFNKTREIARRERENCYVEALKTPFPHLNQDPLDARQNSRIEFPL